MAAVELSSTSLYNSSEFIATSLYSSINCTAYYRFEPGSMVSDSKGTYTLTAYNTPGTANGKFGSCVNFGTANTNKYFENTSVGGITGNVFSVSTWVNELTIPASGSQHDFVGWHIGGGNFFQRFYNNTGTIQIATIRNNGLTQETCGYYTVALGTNTWHHFVSTCDGAVLKLYYDGIYMGSVGISTVNNGGADSLTVGQTNGSGWLSGYIDDVSIFNNKTLNQQEVWTLFTEPYAYYKLENVNDSLRAFTLTNVNTVGFSSGLFGSAADFGTANTNKCLKISNSVGYRGGAYSISMWTKLQAEISSSNWILAQAIDSITDTQFEIWYNYNAGNRTLSFDRNRYGVAYDSIIGTTTFGTNSWHHVVLTYDGAKLIGYLDNTFIGSVAAAGTGANAITDQFTLGAYDDGTGTKGYFASVYIDDVAVFPRALSSNEVNLLYTGPQGTAYMKAGKIW
jgi:hypothetical protein